MSLLIIILAVPCLIWYLAARDHRRAERAGQVEGTVGLAIRLWAWKQVAEPLAFLAIVLYFIFLTIGSCIVQHGCK
ncbi:MAG: hypothetical protein ACHQ7N_13915 [Candidatus Methylomirabilales bacterium]